MDIQTLKELFLTRQSCRSFSSRPVSKEQIEEICSLAALAPSACDLQPWKVYAVTGEKRKPLADFLIGSGKAPFVGDAPAFLIIAENPAASRERPTLSYYAPSDTGALDPRRESRGAGHLYSGLAEPSGIERAGRYNRRRKYSLCSGARLCFGRL